MTPDNPQTLPPTTMPETQQTYETAAARVEEIIRRLDSGEASLNETLELVREGKGLIELCARELAAVGDALEELRLDELVSRLEGEAGHKPGRSRRAGGPASSADDETEASPR
jgi:exodeoxyribonuclease VII small subunit